MLIWTRGLNLLAYLSRVLGVNLFFRPSTLPISDKISHLGVHTQLGLVLDSKRNSSSPRHLAYAEVTDYLDRLTRPSLALLRDLLDS